jgi:hypothetical protein
MSTASLDAMVASDFVLAFAFSLFVDIFELFCAVVVVEIDLGLFSSKFLFLLAMPFAVVFRIHSMHAKCGQVEPLLR